MDSLTGDSSEITDKGLAGVSCRLGRQILIVSVMWIQVPPVPIMTDLFVLLLAYIWNALWILFLTLARALMNVEED